jgi:hypothetical protein
LPLLGGRSTPEATQAIDCVHVNSSLPPGENPIADNNNNNNNYNYYYY